MLAKESIASLLTFKVAWRDLLYQIYFIGVKSQSVVLITGAFTGMVLAAQTYFQFHKVKMDTATLAVVSVSMCSELGPVLTGLMVAGRVGAAIAAEIGTMRVTEQIDALRTLATHPVDYLVVPRLLAAAHRAAAADGGGHRRRHRRRLPRGRLSAGHRSDLFLVQHAADTPAPSDVAIGLIKAFIFGGIVALIGCYKGMCCGEGAEGVGRATTEAVVYSSITILITNFFLTLAPGPDLRTRYDRSPRSEEKLRLALRSWTASASGLKRASRSSSSAAAAAARASCSST